MMILASASAVRARLLRAAGVPFSVQPASLDEAQARDSLLAGGMKTEEIAGALAELKAVRGSTAAPDALVLGCDQTLVFDEELIGKVEDLEAARTLLRRLRGRSHSLVTACVLARAGYPVWRHQERCTLAMRAFSDAFLDAYLAAEGAEVLGSVGCYHLEGRGAQLFERVQGDYFSVLGLPLIALLTALREQEIIES